MATCSPGPWCRTCLDFEECFQQVDGMSEKLKTDNEIKEDYLNLCTELNRIPVCYTEK